MGEEELRKQSDSWQSFVIDSLKLATEFPHIMEFSYIRMAMSLLFLLRKGIIEFLQYHSQQATAVKEETAISYTSKFLVMAINWTFCGDLYLVQRYSYFERQKAIIQKHIKDIEIPCMSKEDNFIDFSVSQDKAEQVKWQLLI